MADTYSFSQKPDTAVYRKLLPADKDNFEGYTREAGLVYTFDTLSNTLFAKQKGLLFARLLASDGKEVYALVLLESSLHKDGINRVVGSATPVPNKKDTWLDGDYMYIEWGLENLIGVLFAG